MKSPFTKVAILLAFTAATALAGDNDKKTIAPAEPAQPWRFSFALPGWATWLEGDTGINGIISHIDLGPGDIIPRIDMAADVRAEAHKGRFSIMSEFLYLSLSDGVGTNTVVKKLDFQVDQMMADLGFGWRVLECPRGYVDVVGGVRYTNFHQKVALQPNDERIDEVSRQLAVAGTAVRVAEALRALAGKDPTVPIAPIDGGDIARLAGAIKHLKGSTAERQAKIADLLHHALSRTVSRTDDWFDPYVGVRGRYNLNEKFYLTAKADIGGFGVGADLTWQAEAAVGMQLSKSMFTEIGYRALGVDYEQDGILMDTITHGFQITTGISF